MLAANPHRFLFCVLYIKKKILVPYIHCFIICQVFCYYFAGTKLAGGDSTSSAGVHHKTDKRTTMAPLLQSCCRHRGTTKRTRGQQMRHHKPGKDGGGCQSTSIPSSLQLSPFPLRAFDFSVTGNPLSPLPNVHRPVFVLFHITLRVYSWTS